MDASSIPTPPTEETAIHHQVARSPASSRRGSSGGVKSVKPINRISKRASNHTPSHDHAAHSHPPHTTIDSRHKRVWKACERCRMKKTKCDGEFPCKRCKDDGLVCTAGTRKKTEYKQLPRGYAEVLENTQFALIATVHKLYAMVRKGQSWDLGEPELNDRGQPVIHNIAQKLGCIRPQNDLDLPVSHIFPEDEAGLSELVTALEAHQKERDAANGASSASTKGASPPSAASSPRVKTDQEPPPRRRERASSSELDHSDLEMDYRKAVFGRMNGPLQSSTSAKGTPSTVASTVPPTLSPQSLTYDFDVGSVASDVDNTSVAASNLFPGASPVVGSFPPQPTTTAAAAAAPWNSRPVSMELTHEQMMQLNAATGAFMDVDNMLNQGLLESEFGRLKPHVMSCPNPEVMMGMGDPMIFDGGFEAESLRM